MNLPSYRTMKYSVWRACETFNILPPGVKSNWDENDVVARANLLAYSQIREVEICTSMANSLL